MGRLQEFADLSSYRIGPLPTIYYITEYVTETEEQAYLREITARASWKQVSGRKLQHYGGQVSDRTGTLLQAPLPSWLQGLLDRLAVTASCTGLGKPNHVLVNCYSPGQGIMAHEDGPVYFPCACILSLGESAIMRFHRKPTEGGHAKDPVASVLLRPRSLLLFSDDAYCHCLHGIAEAEFDIVDASVVNGRNMGVQTDTVSRSQMRISLTVRRVLHVRKNLIRL